jgi:hypothetical protein
VVIPRWVSPRLKPRAECTKPLFRGWGDGRTGELSFDGFKIEGSGWLCSGNDNGRTALRPSNEIELFLTASGPESVLRDVWALLWHSVSKSREVTWDHRSCHRRFSRRVTTAELILRCPDMPSTQRCRLGTGYEHTFYSSSGRIQLSGLQFLGGLTKSALLGSTSSACSRTGRSAPVRPRSSSDAFPERCAD